MELKIVEEGQEPAVEGLKIVEEGLEPVEGLKIVEEGMTTVEVGLKSVGLTSETAGLGTKDSGLELEPLLELVRSWERVRLELQPERLELERLRFELDNNDLSEDRMWLLLGVIGVFFIILWYECSSRIRIKFFL